MKSIWSQRRRCLRTHWSRSCFVHILPRPRRMTHGCFCVSSATRMPLRALRSGLVGVKSAWLMAWSWFSWPRPTSCVGFMDSCWMTVWHGRPYHFLTSWWIVFGIFWGTPLWQGQSISPLSSLLIWYGRIGIITFRPAIRRYWTPQSPSRPALWISHRVCGPAMWVSGFMRTALSIIWCRHPGWIRMLSCISKPQSASYR